MPGWWASRSAQNSAQAAGQLLQAGVVHRGLAFSQVVHEQVTDRPAGELVAVDQLGGRALPRGAQLAQPGRRCRAEDPHLAQQPVELAAPSLLAAPWTSASVSSSSRTIPDGDVGQHAALGGQDDRRPAQRAGAGRLDTAAAEPPSHSARSRANPSGSRNADMARASSACSHPPATSQARDGRTTSAPTAVIKAETSAEVTGPAGPGRRFSQPPGSCRHAAPAASAPLASQRCCQLPPSWPCSQSSSSPQRDPACPGRRPARCSCTCSRACVLAGQSAAGARGGKRVRAAR